MSNQTSRPVAEGEKLLEKVRNLLKSEGVSSRDKIEVENEIESYLLPALDKFREVQRFIYEPFLYEKSGFVGKSKNKVLNRMGNVSRNVVEKSVMRQQKYNDNVYILLMHLYNKNRDLEERLAKLENQKPAKNDKN